jgi:hypothetical protein
MLDRKELIFRIGVLAAIALTATVVALAVENYFGGSALFVMCFQLQPLLRLMSIIFSISCSRRMDHLLQCWRLARSKLYEGCPGRYGKGSLVN